MTASRQIIETDQAPGAIGPYSQAVRCGNTVYISGQIPIDPATQELVAGDIEARAEQAFTNLAAVATAAGGSLADVARVTIYMTDMGDYARINEVMARHFDEPYPARVAFGVAALPKDAGVEIDAIVVLD